MKKFLTLVLVLVLAGMASAQVTWFKGTLDQAAAKAGFDVHYPPLEFCTDNGAMIALAGALRLESGRSPVDPIPRRSAFTVRPRWDLSAIVA